MDREFWKPSKQALWWRERSPADAAYLMFTTAVSEISHTGHRKALLLTSGPFEAIRVSYIGDAQFGHIGRSGDVA